MQLWGIICPYPYPPLLLSTTTLLTTPYINPKNGGAPLIDEAGRVIGINTMLLRGTEGIGLAIPTETALEEFAYHLQ